MTKQEFIDLWCERYHTTEELLLRDKAVIPCSCTHPNCLGWSTVKTDSGAYRDYLAARKERQAAMAQPAFPPYERDASAPPPRVPEAFTPTPRGAAYLQKVQQRATQHQQRRHGMSIEEMKIYINTLRGEMGSTPMFADDDFLQSMVENGLAVHKLSPEEAG